MLKPVINPNTSVLGFRQWQTWDYQPSATNMPVSWDCPGLPPGVSIDTPSGLIAGFSTAPGVWICPLRAFGPPTLAINGISSAYPAAVSTTADHGLTTGDIVRIAGSDCTPSIDGVFEATVLDGTAFSIPVSVTGAGTMGSVAAGSDDFLLTIGIEPAIYDPNECPAFLIDLDTGHISSPDGTRSSAKTDTPLFWVKEGDTLPLMLRFFNGDVFVEMTLSSLVMAVKQFEPDDPIVVGGGPTLDTDFKKFGTDDGAYFVMVTNFTSDALAGALSDNEQDSGTYFYALAEIEYRFPNPFGVGADPLIRTTRTFIVGIERDLQNNV